MSILKINTLQIACILVIGILITSCSPTHKGSYTRYSAANKRERATHVASKEKKTSTYDKKYSYKTKTSATEVAHTNTEVPTTGILTRDQIVLSALKYTGRDYTSGGKTPETGFDCSGFTSYIYSTNGYTMSGSSDQQAKLGIKKSPQSLQPGDLVFFGNEDRISHVAIVASQTDKEFQIVHSTTSAGVKLDNISESEYWQSRLLFGVDIIGK